MPLEQTHVACVQPLGTQQPKDEYHLNPVGHLLLPREHVLHLLGQSDQYAVHFDEGQGNDPAIAAVLLRQLSA